MAISVFMHNAITMKQDITRGLLEMLMETQEHKPTQLNKKLLLILQQSSFIQGSAGMTVEMWMISEL